MRSIRKVLSLLLALLLVMNLGTPAFAAETPSVTLTVDKTDVSVGDTVTVTVGSTGISDVFGMGFKVYADQTVYEVESIETTWTSNNQLEAKGWIKIATFSSTGNTLTPPEPIAVIKLKAKAAAETSSISLSSLEVTKTGADGTSVENVTVTSPEAITTVVKESVVAATGISLDKSELALTVGETGTLTATLTPENATDTVTWTSSDETIATVAEDGTVTAKAVGSATITAKAGDFEATCKVTVKVPISIMADGTACEVTEVSDYVYKVQIPEGADIVLTDTRGTITSVAHKNQTDKYNGERITDDEGNKIKDDALYDTVTTEDGATSITSAEFLTGVLYQCNYDYYVENGVDMSIFGDTANKKIWMMTTASDGKIYTNRTIYVELIPVAVESVTLDLTALELTEEETATLTATVTPENATDKTVTWTSSDESVATVAEDGTVTAVAAGTATITATTTDGGKTATCTVTVTEKQEENPVTGYTYATSADVTAENGGTAVVSVMVTGNSDETVTTYNAYDLTLTFDTDKLELAQDAEGNYIYSGAVQSDNGSVTVDGNTIRIVGCGTDKEFTTAIAALTFKTKTEGEANVTVTKAQVSDEGTAVGNDTPEAAAANADGDTAADDTPDQSLIVVPYTVTKPDFVSGNDSILHGEDYTFSYTDTTNYTYSDLSVTVGGTAVENLTADENGVYTIENVTGAVVITATQTANSYDVTKPENVTGPDEATYGEDYEFTVTPSEGKEIESVTVTTEDGTVIDTTINADGEYVIDGEDISGPITITVTEKDKAATETTITFSGVDAAEVEGGLTQTATIGQAFSFKLNKVDGYTYTVMVGDTELTETDGQYTIPAELVVEGGVTVAITKEDTSKATVDVHEYISLDGKTMFLVNAKWGDKVLAYGEGNTMFWSSKYTVTGETEAGAYSWLVVSTDEMNTVDQVKAAAEAAIVEAGEGTTATAVAYDYDVNQTTKVDVNDAQLVYDMYNASYMEFTETLPMLKFLEADVAETVDMKLDVNDVVAVINYIVNGAAN